MKFAILVLFFFPTIFLYFNPVWVKAFPKNLTENRLDTLIINDYDSEGSYFHKKQAVYIDGKGNDTCIISRYIFEDRFISVIPICDGLVSKGRAKIPDGIKKALIGRIEEAPIDGSLQWLLDIYMQNDSNNHKSGLFSKVLVFKPKWIKKELSAPANYYIIIQDTAIQRIYGNWFPEDLPSISNGKYSKAILVYYGAMHNGISIGYAQIPTFKYIDSCDNRKLFITAHGVILRRNNEYMWCFVSDGILDGPYKLRYQSINNAKVTGKYIYVSQHYANDPSANYLYVIDPIRGVVCRIDPEKYYPNGFTDFELTKSSIIIANFKDKKVILIKNIDEQIGKALLH